MKVQQRIRDRHPRRHLWLVPPSSRWTSYDIAGLIELGWTLGRQQERLGVATWRDRATFADRVAVTAALLDRTDPTPTRRSDVAPASRRRTRRNRPRGGAA